MQSQKIVNILDHKDEMIQDLKEESGILLMITVMEIIARVMM